MDLDRQRVFRAAAPEEEPGFRLCLITVLYLLSVDTAGLGPPVSPLELTGATTFFQSRGPHAIPSAPLEDRFGRDLAGFLEVGRRLGAETRASGDGALAFQVYPGLTVEVILWVADDEFPAQVSFTVPSGLDRFWQLDAVLGLMGLVVKELLRTADPHSADSLGAGGAKAPRLKLSFENRWDEHRPAKTNRGQPAPNILKSSGR